MFIQQNQSLLENSFVAVRFDIVGWSATNKLMCGEHC